MMFFNPPAEQAVMFFNPPAGQAGVQHLRGLVAGRGYL
jgi:hypothetical protein